MSKILLTSILLTCLLQVHCSDDRAKIRTSGGNLYLEPARGKSIYLRTNGPQSAVFLDDVSLINATSRSYNPTQIANTNIDTKTFTSEDVLRRLQILESRNSVTNEDFVRNISALALRISRISSRLSRLQRQLEGTGDKCELHTCQNGGTCLNLVGDFHCLCPSNWEGRNCEIDVNECRNFAGTDLGCQNGADCVNKPGSYECQCRTGWFGTHCTRRKLDCSAGNSEMCGHGTCVPVSSGEGIKCICDQGWTTNGSVACLTDVNECDTSLGARCSTNPMVECINLPGSFRCGQCPQGFQGDGYVCYDIDECATSNGGCSSMVSCHNTIGSRICGACPPGYLGDGVTCTWRGSCSIDHGGCHPSARCVENPGLGGGVQCYCPQGMDGDGVGLHGCYVSTENGTQSCESDPCGPHGRCHILRNGYTCFCFRGFSGAHCDAQAENCATNPCKNGGVCRPDDTATEGFRCECTAQYTGTLCQERSHCGSILRAEEGSLVYPLPNTTFSRNSKCAWIIRTTPEKVINVTFSSFNLEPSPDCTFNFLQLHDGRSTADPLIGRFCGKEAPKGGHILSSQHNLYLWFLSNGVGSRNVFSLHWNSVAPVCGGVVNATTHGSISSPGSPGKYPPNRDCYWHLTTTLGKRIQLHFFQLDLETHDNCSFDYVAIYDGHQVTDQLLEKYCSSTQPAPLLSTGPEMFIHFHSDAHGNGKGFQITYAPADGVPGCGGIFSGDRGEVSSPSYDGSYLSNLICEYKIRTGPDTQIELDFKLFDLERSRSCRHDYLKIYDGASAESPIIGTYCGKLDRKIQLNSTSNNIFMVFKSDRSIHKEGFRISYKVICKYFIRGDSGVIKSPGYPFTYPDKRVCEYVIETSPGKAIQLAFQDFDIEGDRYCNYDNVVLRDGWNENATLLGKYCGNKIPKTHTSSSNMMYVRFKSDMSQSGSGFYANFTTLDIECGGIYKDERGTINHPSDGDKYKNDQTCIWIIMAPPEKHIELTWNRFTIEKTPSCHGDYLALIVIDDDDNNSTLAKYCDKNLPPTLTVATNKLMLKFVSDSSLKYDGFSVTYNMVDAKGNCGGNYIQNHGVIYSPGWPNRYDKNLDCVWVISAMSGQKIKLNISQFDLESSNYATRRCDDFLQIRNGPAASSPLIAEYCGEFNWQSITSISNTLYIRFHSDFLIGGGGFKIEWDGTVTGCGGTVTGYEGSISSPNYPEKYQDNSECFYRIVTNPGSRISLTFEVLELERFICDDYVEIYDGRDPSSSKLGRFCKWSQNRVMETSSNYAYVKFKADFLMNGKGFLLNYKAICNNNITGQYGVIESLNFPGNYPENLNCSWTINVPKGNKINASFTDFHIRRSPRWSYLRDHDYHFGHNPSRGFYHGVSHRFSSPLITAREENVSCSLDYVMISEPGGAQSPRYCGYFKPMPVTTKSNSLQITFNTRQSSLRFLDQSKGFRLEWVSYGCRGHIKKRMGVLNKTMSSSEQMECEWLIETDLETSIFLNFKKVYMLESNDCNTDAIEIYNGPTTVFPLLTKFCHDTVSVQSTSNFLLIRLIKNSSLKDLHFTAFFSSVYQSCGGYMRTQSGVITSKNYPKNYDNNLDCVWNIIVPRNHRVAIDFTDVDLNNDVDKCDDSIKLYENDVLNSNYTLRICDSSGPKNYVSKSSKLVVQFVTNGASTAKGFKANFSMTCGGIITTTDSENGLLSNENFISNSNASCVWTILAPTLERKVSLTITHLSLPITNDRRTNQTCPNSYLRVLDGDDEDAPLIDEYCGRAVPATIVSHGSALTVQLGTHADRITGLFLAHYSTVDTSCGGTFTSESGIIASPNYPGPYPNNADCEWKLKTSPGNRVSINLSMLDLAYSEECNEDYLEIRERDGAGQILGLYCGNVATTNTTASSELYIKFHSDNKSPGRGFLIHYEFLHGNDITNLDRGEIASPLYPRPYDGSGEFWWRITSGNQVLSIEVDELQIHTHSENCDDNLSIYDGHDDNAPLLTILCGALHSDKRMISTTSNAAYIKLTLNDANTGAFFHLRWSQIDSDLELTTVTQNCGRNNTFILNPGMTDSFFSPDYPKNYKEDLNCEWVYKATTGRHLSLKFFDFDVEERDPCTNGDYVSVYTADVPMLWKPIKEEMCLKSETQQVFNGSTFLKITFTSDYSYVRKGFLAQVQSQCGGIITDPSGIIETTARDFDGLAFGQKVYRCDWKVTVRPGRRIKVEFNYFNITNKENDCQTYLILHNGESQDSPRLSDGKYCGYSHENRNAVETSSNNLVVSYITNDKKKSHTFRLHYEEVQQDCGATSKLDADHTWEIITSPNYPNVPDAYAECDWRFTVPTGEILRIDFIERFDIRKDDDCASEYVEIHDGATVLSPIKGRYCGSNPGTIKTTDNNVYIKYMTELSEPNNGFKANVSIDVCGGTITASQGEVTSPGYPNTLHLPAGTVCEWRIIGTVGQVITITPQEMNLPESEAQCGTKVTIEELVPLSNVDEVLKTYCTQTNLDETAVQSSSNNVTIKLHIGQPSGYVASDFHPGFRLAFKSTTSSCNEQFTTSEGYLTTPGYPRDSTSNFCSWSITGPDQRRISLEILDSGKYSIFISDGDFEHRIAYSMEFDIATDNTTFKSSSNKMSISLRKIGDGPFRFKARFTSDEPVVCGGSLTGNTGQLISREYDESYYCNWKYNADLTDTTQEYNTIFVTGNVNSSASSMRTRCLYFDPKVTIKVPVERYNRKAISICNSDFSLRVPKRSLQINAEKDSSQYLNFVIRWKLQPCGGIIRVGENPISVINVPSSYNDTIDCAWELKSTTKVEITLVGSFRLNCADEFVKIGRHDNILPQGYHVVGDYCKDKIQDKPLILPYNAIVEYHSKSPNTTNITVSAKLAAQTCGGLYRYPIQFSSPNFPKGYASNTECVWEIETVDFGFRVSLEFVDRFVIEKAANCSKDAVIIYDWKDDDYVEVARLCGRELPPVFNSTSERLKVVLRTDNDINLDGFKARWTSICGGKLTATTTEQYIYSPGYPYYRPSKTCVYRISAPKEKIAFKFLDFDIEGYPGSCDNDNLTISSTYFYETYCGSEIPKLNAMSDEVKVTFNSDSNIQKRGFKMSYSIYSCGGHVTQPTVLRSSLLDNYSSDMNCTWIIEAPKNKTIVLEFKYFHLEQTYECNADYLAAYDGPEVDEEKRLALLCGKIKSLTTIKSTGNTMTVEFVTDSYLEYDGFQINVRFTYSESAGCGRNLYIRSPYTLTSPFINSPFAYENFLDCQWNIEAPVDHVIKVSFTSFHVAPCRDVNQTALGFSQCDCDFLQIKDGINPDSLVIGTYCGHNLPPELVTSGNKLGIRLSTDGEITSAGFTANFKVQESVCGQTSFNVTGSKVRVTSPGYGTGNIARGIHCVYHFSDATYGLSHIHLNNLKLQPGSSGALCDKDRIMITSDSLTRTKSLGKDFIVSEDSSSLSASNFMYFYDVFSSTTTPDEYVICGNKATADLYLRGPFSINLITSAEDVSEPYEGVDLEVSVVGPCGKNYTEPYGKIVTGIDIDGNITDCYTLITANENSTISLYFNTIDATFMPPSTYLDIYDGNTTSSRKIKTVKEETYDSGDPVFSTGRYLLIHNHLKRNDNHVTYDLMYMTTDKGQGCGGHFFGTEGTVTSPLYPAVYRQAKSCEWVLETPHGTRLSLHFETFNLGRDCEHNSVQLVDRAGATLASYCSEEPALFTSEDNYVKIIFVTSRNNGGTGWVGRFLSVV